MDTCGLDFNNYTEDEAARSMAHLSDRRWGALRPPPKALPSEI